MDKAEVILEVSQEVSEFVNDSLSSQGVSPILCLNRAVMPRGSTSPFLFYVRKRDMSITSDNIILGSSEAVRLAGLSFGDAQKRTLYTSLRAYTFGESSKLKEIVSQAGLECIPSVIPYFRQEDDPEFGEFYCLSPTKVIIGRERIRTELSDMFRKTRTNFLSIEGNKKKINLDFDQRLKDLQISSESNCLTSALYLSGMINSLGVSVDVYDMGSYLNQCDVVHNPAPRDLAVWQDKSLSGKKIHTPHAGVVVNSNPVMVCHRASPDSPLLYELVESAGREYHGHQLAFYRPRKE